ncbi:hypothetical protein [Rhodopirellula halodulae]|uniref:hypothetical protein n=1 Tax=Rhodopirellula halodulae TaxID=2894198 RepID=UPI001E3F63A8|nr:hypothetical protein [Rhodopirellula sp. JC737]MCC9656408.1 hypothetical protein [Rhodopirellula sp. JC737]
MKISKLVRMFLAAGLVVVASGVATTPAKASPTDHADNYHEFAAYAHTYSAYAPVTTRLNYISDRVDELSLGLFDAEPDEAIAMIRELERLETELVWLELLQSQLSGALDVAGDALELDANGLWDTLVERLINAQATAEFLLEIYASPEFDFPIDASNGMSSVIWNIDIAMESAAFAFLTNDSGVTGNSVPKIEKAVVDKFPPRKPVKGDVIWEESKDEASDDEKRKDSAAKGETSTEKREFKKL